MTIQQAWPEFKYLHLLQPRLDKQGHTVEDFISRISETSFGSIPIEITSRGMATTIRYLGDLGWSRISTLICELYPNQ